MNGHNDAGLLLTRGASMEVVVVLRDIRQDTEAVRNPKSHHVFCVQQSWNPQLFFCNFKGLEIKIIFKINKTLKGLGFCECSM